MPDYNNNRLQLPGNLVNAIIEKAEVYKDLLDENQLSGTDKNGALELLDSISDLKEELDELKACLEMWDWFNTQLVTTDTEGEAIEATLQMYGDRFGESSRYNLETMLISFIENK